MDLNLTFMQTPGSRSDPLTNGLVDTFTNMQINMIGPFDWQYQADCGDICNCTSCGKFYLSLTGKQFVCKILQLVVQDSSVFHMDFVPVSVLDAILPWYSRSVFQRLKVFKTQKSCSQYYKSQGCFRHSFCQLDMENQLYFTWSLMSANTGTWQAVLYCHNLGWVPS